MGTYVDASGNLQYDLTTQDTVLGAQGNGAPRIQVIKNWNAIDIRDYFPTAGGSATAAAAAINAALIAAQTHSETRTVLVPPGTWGLEASVGRTDTTFLTNVQLRGQGRNMSTLRINDGTNIDAITGAWESSRIEGLTLDCNMSGNPSGTKQRGFNVHLDFTAIARNSVKGWRTAAFNLNDGTYSTDLGLLNRISENYVEESSTYGIYATFRFTDSWVERNNIGATIADMSIEGGPLRILDNHLNGNARYNLISRGVQDILLNGNILEHAGRESVLMILPDYQGAGAEQNIIITGNMIRGNSQDAPGTFPAVTAIGLNLSTKQVRGLTLTGNEIITRSGDGGMPRALDVSRGKTISAVGNIWSTRSGSNNPVRALQTTNIEVVGNGGDNTIDTNLTTVTPVGRADVILDLDADSQVLAVAAPVSSWSDGSSYGNNASQGTLANQPTMAAGGPNGHKAIAFAGGQWMSVANSTSLNVTNGLSIHAVINPTDTNSARRIVEKGNTVNQYQFYFNGSGQVVFSVVGVGNLTSPASGISSGAWHVVSAMYDRENLLVFVDGALVKTSFGIRTVMPTSTDPLNIGNKPNSTTAGDSFNGSMTRVVMRSGPGCVGDHAAIDAFLMARYGITPA